MIMYDNFVVLSLIWCAIIIMRVSYWGQWFKYEDFHKMIKSTQPDVAWHDVAQPDLLKTFGMLRKNSVDIHYGFNMYCTMICNDDS